MRRLCILLLTVLASPAFGQHLGSRLQWQPETMAVDARLDQPVEIEIIGRAAVPAMKMLSDKTGVSLGVAPEDLDTVGERKLTIIAKGLPLRVIMVQLPEALQEAHWDIDASAAEPMYVLHRNAGVEAAAEQENQERRAAVQEARRQRTRESIDDARRALAMSPAALDDLEKTDIFLARAARYAPTRSLMEAYVSLPEEELTKLADAGHLELPYNEAPAALRDAIGDAVQLERRYLEWARAQPGLPYPDTVAASATEADSLQAQLEAGGDVTIHIIDHGREVGIGPLLQIESDEGSIGMMLVPARLSRMNFPGNPYEWLLVQTGDTPEQAVSAIQRSTDEWLKLRDARQWDESGWVEPTDPRLHRVVEFPIRGGEGAKYVSILEFEQLVAAQTGISIVSDYFTDANAGIYPGQPPLGDSLWRDLYNLGRTGQFTWRQAGDCLVFHHTDWYRRAQFELPESLIADYQARLSLQGHLTLDDVAELASVLTQRPSPNMRGWFALPGDLSEAGAPQTAYPRWALLLWHELSPQERTAAQSEEGLRFADLSVRRAATLENAAWPSGGPFGDSRAPEDQVRGGVFRARCSTGTDEHGAYTRWDLAIETADSSWEPMSVQVMLYEVAAVPPASGPGESTPAAR